MKEKIVGGLGLIFIVTMGFLTIGTSQIWALACCEGPGWCTTGTGTQQLCYDLGGKIYQNPGMCVDRKCIYEEKLRVPNAQASVSINIGTGDIGFNASSGGMPEGEIELVMAGDVIETEILELQLKGPSPIGPIQLTERSDASSTGLIFNIQIDPDGHFVEAESFFDVFLDIVLTGPSSRNLFNKDPIVIGALITSLPWTATYLPEVPEPVFLYDRADPGGPPVGTLGLSSLLMETSCAEESTAAGNCSDGVDNDCDGAIDAEDSGCGGYFSVANALAASYGTDSLQGSGVFNEVALVLMPIGAFILLRILRRKK